uniref:Uncharacterized protein n=1 Tax=Acrobeloides nanus TaxID=290746 RepID=A0A914D3H0_9BILA
MGRWDRKYFDTLNKYGIRNIDEIESVIQPDEVQQMEISEDSDQDDSSDSEEEIQNDNETTQQQRERLTRDKERYRSKYNRAKDTNTKLKQKFPQQQSIQNVLVGMRQVSTKSAKEQLDTLKDVLRQIDQITENQDNVAEEIVMKILAFMGDRATVNNKFYKLFEEYRLDV